MSFLEQNIQAALFSFMLDDNHSGPDTDVCIRASMPLTESLHLRYREITKEDTVLKYLMNSSIRSPSQTYKKGQGALVGLPEQS